ncbi:MAG: PepSY-associated TM helix domain-containing protein [Herminiimonas sp.]|uniref:PepSY-associated TM helix domain-containing protein n=1 Tax=Herminiimonas sp. TaxID=1926289 RepID=UPI0027281E60|nr:PepSY-associated TM helix domain-containing protein [Herminiimonas sp.]MDO9422070.1 PepSY-associated TM helix domain-containing protein [Herminiimonas sp.]
MNARAKSPQRAYWLKTLHQWHWISSALCLLGMLLFSVTGITLNHSSQIEAKPQISTQEAQLPADLQAQLAELNTAEATKNKAQLSPELARWMKDKMSLDVSGRDVDWSPEEAYVALPRPGGDAWVRIDRASGAVESESTNRGWISYLNDLHKGRNTGEAWSWFIDIFAAACLIFSITGLFILKMHATNRPSTWPIVGLGALIPFLLAILFIH